LGRKLGGHFKITATHETKSNFGAVLSRTQQTVNKGSSELQQIFGKMVSQADTPVPISKEGTIKRPVKW
jgi:hypothetical protein